MRRYEALAEVMKVLTDELVVCNLGHPAQELFSICDRPRNFYMLGSMGLATSIGHGLALSQDKTVVVIDGDAATTMNMGGFATIAHTRPKNLIQIIIDNGANGSTGFQPSFTAGRLRLDEVARASGIADVRVVTDQQEIVAALKDVLKERRGPSVILIKTDIGMPNGIGVIPLSGTDIKSRFIENLSR